jgi:uncharacterized protein
VTIRGAVSIARRLQDPLAELVKIDPKSIGVGQYQHDLGEHKLSRSLDSVVEDCVNAVGVDANTASAPLLARVSESERVWRKILSCTATPMVRSAPARRSNKYRGWGPRHSAVRRLPALRTATHSMPPVSIRILSGGAADHPGGQATSKPSEMPQPCASSRKDVRRRDIRLPTVTDILRELEKPGRDPRPASRRRVQEGVET